MSDVLKVNHLEGDVIKKIYVFSGTIHVDEDNSWTLPKGKSVFTSEELSKVQKENIPVEIVPGYLHGDDTISTIKNKIVEYTKLRLSSKEIYIFGIHQQIINTSVIYNRLTQSDTVALTKQRLCQFLLNVVPNGCADDDVASKCDTFLDQDKDQYDIEDFVSLKDIDWSRQQNITIPIGQKLVIKKRYPYVINPYNCITMDPILKKEASNILTTQNSNLLFEYGELCNNNIFLCIAEEVLNYADTIPDVGQAEFMSLYFPNLVVKDNITSLKQLHDKKIALYDAQKELTGKAFDAYNERIDFLYNVYDHRTSDLDYEDNTPGILKMEFTIHPEYSIRMPLDILFKLINSDKIIPMIKYNPGKDRENIYRLYTNNETATNGKKIPYLYTHYGNKKGKIIRLSRVLARRKRVAFYIEYQYKAELYVIFCEFEVNGNINVRVEHEPAVELDTLQAIVKAAINEPILEKVKNFLEQSGYVFQVFNSFDDNNIEFKDITFVSLLKIKKKIHLRNYIGCLSGVFTIIDDSLMAHRDEIRLKYKRVSNYNELDSIESLINEMRRMEESHETIVKRLIENFDLTEIQAKERYASWASQINVETDLFENKAVTVRTNTGFPVSIVRDKSNFKTTIRVGSINEVHYLRYIHIYVDTMLRLLTDKKSTSVPTDKINKLCKDKEVKEMDAEKDIKTNEIRFSDDEDKGSFLDMFGQVEETPDEEGQVNEDTDFGDIEFGSFDEELKGKEDEGPDFEGVEFGDFDADSKSHTGQDIDFEGVDFGDFDADSKSHTGEDIDFEGIQFGDFDTKPPSKEEEHLEFEGIEFGDFGTDLKSKSKRSPSSKPVDSVSPQSDTTSEMEMDLRGLILKGSNNIFMKKKEKLQPKLFRKKASGRFKAYSKACPSQYAKQPIILTGKEKDYIDGKDKEHGTKSYDEFLTYGTGDETYHYICPRFWCLADDNGKARSVSLKEINEGVCGGWDALVPPGASKVPEGKRIVQFTDKRFHKSGVDTNNIMVYKPMFPGFMDKSKHQDGLCIPCCFTRPTHFNGLKSGWKKNKDKKKYYNDETGVKDHSEYPNDISYDDMYKPEGEGPEGPGPSFDRDGDGNIIMDSIKGTKQNREAPAGVRKRTFKECNQDEKEEEGVVTTKTAKLDEAPLLEAWPLSSGQIGYIPMSVQKFLGYNCRELCQHNMTESRLKINQPCLLHKGVESSETQSFLACIADVHALASDGAPLISGPLPRDPIMTILELKRVIIKTMTIDRFVSLQNGGLVDIFAKSEEEVNQAPYKDSLLAKSLRKSLSEKEYSTYLSKVISALENFRNFINDKDVVIDYEYLWDFVSKPQTEYGGGLFKSGLNLIILNSPDDDITTKIELICPTNQYSDQVYDIKRPTLMLYSRNGYYEPIYRYTKLERNVYNVHKLFYLQNIGREMPDIEYIVKFVWSNITTKCRPLPSMPHVYNDKHGFSSNISFDKAKDIFDKSDTAYMFKTQVVNFNSKTIGILVEKKADPADTVYIPCAPSAIDETLPYEFIGRGSMWTSYTDTVQRLRYLKRASKNKLLCRPLIRVVSNNVIVGIITQTNQFVPVIPEAYQAPPDMKGKDAEEPDGLKTIFLTNTKDPINYLNNDKELLTTHSVDAERVKKVKSIKLESHFYNIFRNLLRIVLTYYEHKTDKNALLDNILSPVISYYDKLLYVKSVIKRIVSKYVEFVDYKGETLAKILKIEQCLNLSEEKCKKRSYCMLVENKDDTSECKLLLSKTNLISGGDNSVEYFARLANELIKFDRIRTFIFKPRTFLSFQELPYNLRDDEIILLEDLLYGSYFRGLVPMKDNPFIADNVTWGTAEPSTSPYYVDTFDLDLDTEADKGNECIELDARNKKLTLGKWRDDGLEEYQIVEFKQGFNCSWELFAKILDVDKVDRVVEMSQVVNSLIAEYKRMFDSGLGPDILRIMQAQGKKTQAGSLKRGVAFADIITTTNYYLTSIDFFILSNVYKIPLIILCRTKIPTTFSKYISFIGGNGEICYVIFVGGFADADSSHSPIYGLLSRDHSVQLSIAEMGAVFERITKLNVKSMSSYVLRAKNAAILGKRKKIKVVVRSGSTVADSKRRVKKVKGKVKISKKLPDITY